MDGAGQRVKSLQKGGRGSIQKLVRDTEDAAGAYRAQRLPLPLFHHASKRNPVSGAAPGKDEHVRIKGSDRLSIGHRAGLAQKASPGRGN